MRKIPATEIALPGGIQCAPRQVELPAWQAHVLKHPLGLNGARRARCVDAWNAERWDTLVPAAIDEKERANLFARIGGLGDNHQRCPVAEVRGKLGAGSEPECYACREPLILGCARIVNEVGDRYAIVTERVLSALADGLLVKRAELSRRVMAALRDPAALARLVVLSAGKASRSQGWFVRISRSDGVRVELSLGAQGRAEWRTTYREPKVTDPFGMASFLLESLIPDPSLSLSDVYGVPRGWWEGHGS